MPNCFKRQVSMSLVIYCFSYLLGEFHYEHFPPIVTKHDQHIFVFNSTTSSKNGSFHFAKKWSGTVTSLMLVGQHKELLCLWHNLWMMFFDDVLKLSSQFVGQE